MCGTYVIEVSIWEQLSVDMVNKRGNGDEKGDLLRANGHRGKSGEASEAQADNDAFDADDDETRQDIRRKERARGLGRKDKDRPRPKNGTPFENNNEPAHHSPTTTKGKADRSHRKHTKKDSSNAALQSPRNATPLKPKVIYYNNRFIELAPSGDRGLSRIDVDGTSDDVTVNQMTSFTVQVTQEKVPSLHDSVDAKVTDDSLAEEWKVDLCQTISDLDGVSEKKHNYKSRLKKIIRILEDERPVPVADNKPPSRARVIGIRILNAVFIFLGVGLFMAVIGSVIYMYASEPGTTLKSQNATQIENS